MSFIEACFHIYLAIHVEINVQAWIHTKIQMPKKQITYFLSVSNSTGTLLSMTTSELVTNLWCFHSPHSNLDKLVTFLVDCYHHLVREISRLGITNQHNTAKLVLIKTKTYTAHIVSSTLITK